MAVLVCLVLLVAALTEAREEEIATDSTDQCELPKKIGHCRAAFPRYYFNAVTQECELFNYGGCGTEGNNMKTKQLCEEMCKRDMDFKAAHTKNGLNLACSFTPNFGKPCSPRGLEIEKWYYEEKSETCKSFMFSGCGGNQNQFNDQEECDRICGITTEEEQEEGEERRKVSVKKDAPLGEDNQEKKEKATKRFKREEKSKKLTEKTWEEDITKRLSREARKAKKLA